MKQLFSIITKGFLFSIFLFPSCNQISSIEEKELLLDQIQKSEGGFTLESFKNGKNNEAMSFSEPSGIIRQVAPDCLNGECYYFSDIEFGTELGDFDFFEAFSSSSSNGYIHGNVRLKYDLSNRVHFDINYDLNLSVSNNERPIVYVSGTFLGNFNETGSKFGSTNRELNPAGDGPDFYYSEADNSSAFDYSIVNCGNSFTFTLILSISGEEIRFSKEYYLVPFCFESCDEETFSYSLNPLENESVDLRFSYNYENEADLTLEFEFSQLELDDPKAESYIGADGKVYMISKNKKSKTLTWTGSVGCSVDDPTTFDFAGLLPECKGKGGPNKTRAIWTDARVVAIDGVPLVDLAETPENEGPYSLKGDLEDIEFVGCN